MNFELFIARRLKLGKGSHTGSPSINIAFIGVVLAVVVMILSITIVMGFKNEITEKIYCLDSHLKISNAALGLNDNYYTVNAREIYEGIKDNSAFQDKVESMSLIADKPAILKTDEDFKGVQYRGVDKYYDWTYIENHLSEGRVPCFADSANKCEVIISNVLANELKLKVGDKIPTYFIDNNVKLRNSIIVGLYSSDFETFDKSIVMGNISLLQQVNGWDSDTGNYVGINVKDVDNVVEDAKELYSILVKDCYNRENSTLYCVTHTRSNNLSFFAWLDMLDMNVVIILTLMLIVSGFTLISAMLMIILERIKMIGTFKALGCVNASIRRIFIYLTHKLVFKALLCGNIVGISLALIQQNFHVIKLNADVYYMPYVPVSIHVGAILILNIGIIIISYLTLLGPSYIVSSIKPTMTMRFD